ncbi:MAG: type III pantothenate kinase [Acidimicrobiales bacterium]
MLLTIDVGNTHTVIGVFEAPGPVASDGSSATSEPAVRPPGPSPARSATRLGGELPDLRYHWRVATDASRTADEHALLVVELLKLVGMNVQGDELPQQLSGIAVSSSVPTATAALREMAHRWFPVPTVVIEPGVRTGMPILYDNPKEVGADRIANAVGALDLFDAPLIVVDLGTATTFDVISGTGEYLGGAIAPGIEISTDALFASAAALRRVEFVEPRNVIGKSTVESIQSGVIYGQVALVDGLCRRIQEDLGEATVLATGGLASVIVPLSQEIDHHEPWLTLHGLRIVFERNAERLAARG